MYSLKPLTILPFSPPVALPALPLLLMIYSSYRHIVGMHQQTAEIKNEVMGKVIGKCSGNITLIKVKSGANVQVQTNTSYTFIK